MGALNIACPQIEHNDSNLAYSVACCGKTVTLYTSVQVGYGAALTRVRNSITPHRHYKQMSSSKIAETDLQTFVIDGVIVVQTDFRSTMTIH